MNKFMRQMPEFAGIVAVARGKLRVPPPDLTNRPARTRMLGSAE
jgi:hypothetical protein